MVTLPLIECEVTLLSPEEGGRLRNLPPRALLGDQYRPHLVIGDPNRRGRADGSPEEYIGVAFHRGPETSEVGVPMTVYLELVYYPHPMYEKLKPDVTFTVREGARIVAFGAVRKWLPGC